MCLSSRAVRLSTANVFGGSRGLPDGGETARTGTVWVTAHVFDLSVAATF